MSQPKIVSCVVGPFPKRMRFTDPLPKVAVVFDDGTAKDLFQFFPDELSFTEAEFVGKTEQEAYELFHKKDLAYLNS
jgi:hypothetical protein